MDRRGFFRSLSALFLGGLAALVGKTLSGCYGPIYTADSDATVSDSLLAAGLARYHWHYDGRYVSGNVVSYRDPNTIDMVVQVNGQDISVPVDQYRIRPGDEVTVSYL